MGKTNIQQSEKDKEAKILATTVYPGGFALKSP